jgi:type VI secretion system secreted protein Hcp
MMSVYLKASPAPSIGEIRGPVRDRDPQKDGSIALLAIEHRIVSPRDAASGLSTGKRQHFALTVTKEPDNTSPLFYQLLTTNGAISAVDLIFFGQEDRSAFLQEREINLYTITLTSVFVSEIALSCRAEPASDDTSQIVPIERISFVYDTIRWKWNHPSVDVTDAFNAREG